MEHKLQVFAAEKALSRILKYVDKDVEGNLLKILDFAENNFKMFPQKNFDKMKNALMDKDNVFV